jgi:hypothetical protein
LRLLSNTLPARAPRGRTRTAGRGVRAPSLLSQRSHSVGPSRSPGLPSVPGACGADRGQATRAPACASSAARHCLCDSSPFYVTVHPPVAHRRPCSRAGRCRTLASPCRTRRAAAAGTAAAAAAVSRCGHGCGPRAAVTIATSFSATVSQPLSAKSPVTWRAALDQFTFCDSLPFYGSA